MLRNGIRSGIRVCPTNKKLLSRRLVSADYSGVDILNAAYIGMYVRVVSGAGPSGDLSTGRTEAISVIRLLAAHHYESRAGFVSCGLVWPFLQSMDPSLRQAA